MNKKFLLIILIALFSFTSCGAIKREKVDTRKVPLKGEDRARKNLEEGRGISIQGLLQGGRNTNYEFSTSNPLWRASLEILDFIPLSTVDYSGGVIITDWYNDSGTDDSIKITVRFLSNEIATQNLKVIVHKKNCGLNENCKISEVKSKIQEELIASIVKKAAELDKANKEKK